MPSTKIPAVAFITGALLVCVSEADSQTKTNPQTKATPVSQRISSAAREAWPGSSAASVGPVATQNAVRLSSNSEPGRLPPAMEVETRRALSTNQDRMQITRRPSPSDESGGVPLLPGDEDSVLPVGPSIGRTGRSLRVKDYSQIYIESVKPTVISQNDIVTIVVDEKSEVIMNQRFNRQRTSKLKAELKDFVRLGETGNLANAAANSPAIDGQINSGLAGTGTITDQEGIKYRIAATVKDVKPNGTITLVARKEIQTQDDASEYLLTGEIRSQDIKPDNTASSEDIANLTIVKRAKGRVYDSTKRGWGVRIFDAISPF